MAQTGSASCLASSLFGNYRPATRPKIASGRTLRLKLADRPKKKNASHDEGASSCLATDDTCMVQTRRHSQKAKIGCAAARFSQEYGREAWMPSPHVPGGHRLLPTRQHNDAASLRQEGAVHQRLVISTTHPHECRTAPAGRRRLQLRPSDLNSPPRERPIGPSKGAGKSPR